MKLTRTQLDLTIDSLRREIGRVSAERRDLLKWRSHEAEDVLVQRRLQQLMITKIKFEKLKIQNDLRKGKDEVLSTKPPSQ